MAQHLRFAGELSREKTKLVLERPHRRRREMRPSVVTEIVRAEEAELGHQLLFVERLGEWQVAL